MSKSTNSAGTKETHPPVNPPSPCPAVACHIQRSHPLILLISLLSTSPPTLSLAQIPYCNGAKAKLTLGVCSKVRVCCRAPIKAVRDKSDTHCNWVFELGGFRGEEQRSWG